VSATVKLFHGDCIELLPRMGWADAVVTDPPYGIGYRVNARPPRGAMLKGIEATATAARGQIEGDDKPFDPAPFLAFRGLAFFGANHFARRLPNGGKWIVWDKRGDMRPDDHSDGELIWTNASGALRIHRQKWRGVVREGEENCSRSKKLHPNQKPVALLTFIMAALGLAPGQTVMDPYMGSGSTGVAAVRLGLNFIGCEIDSGHFAMASKRLQAESAA